MCGLRLVGLSAGLAIAGLCAPLAGQTTSGSSIEIRLVSGTDQEQAAKKQLERVLATWDLSRWLFTRIIEIQSGVIPHSHPVLTVNTQYLDNDIPQLATLVHEELHWFLVRHGVETDSAIAELERLYPAVPERPPDGANGRRSTYLHLLDCLLEFDGVRALLDETTARQTLGAFPYYRWVYREVLEHPEPIRGILRKYGLDAPDARF
jgi:hypothetical protein